MRRSAKDCLTQDCSPSGSIINKVTFADTIAQRLKWPSVRMFQTGVFLVFQDSSNGCNVNQSGRRAGMARVSVQVSCPSLVLDMESRATAHPPSPRQWPDHPRPRVRTGIAQSAAARDHAILATGPRTAVRCTVLQSADPLLPPTAKSRKENRK